jgi:hypothetical protein
MPANASFDQIASTTFKNLEKTIADNVSGEIPLLRYFKMKGAVVTDGGDTIVRPIYTGFSNAQSYAGSDAIDITKPDILSAAEYNWKQTVCPVIIEGIEKARNMGKEQQINLLDALKENAQLSMADKVSEMIFGDGTGNGGKDVLGLKALIAEAPTTGTVGGISRSANTWWRNYYDTSVGASGTYLLPKISTALRAICRGNDKKDVVGVCGSTVFGYLQAIAFGKAQMNNPALGEMNFEALKVEGVDIIYDANMGVSDGLYLVNLKSTKLYIHSSYNFVMGPFIEPANQDILVAKLKLYAQLTSNRLGSCAVLSGITAS